MAAKVFSISALAPSPMATMAITAATPITMPRVVRNERSRCPTSAWSAIRSPSPSSADEPTGNLDSATGEEIIRLFGELHARGHTILLVTHEPRLAARCPRAIRLSDGRVVGDGPGAEIAALGAARAVHG